MVIQFLITLMGSDHDHDVDHGEFDTVKVGWLSKQALTGFLMLFGWVGLACLKEFQLSTPFSLMIAFAAGILDVVITAFIFKFAKRLESRGTVFNLEDAIGKEATVYHQIPQNGVGKISISLHHLTHEIDAISDGEEIASFEIVQVIKKADEKTVIVSKK
jgi:hypothetical protein